MGAQRTVREVAQEQWSIVRHDQLCEIGLSDRQIARRVKQDHLHRRHRAIYSYGTDRPPVKGVLLAAQWSCGDTAYLTGRTALGLAQVRGIFLGKIEIAVPRRIRPRTRPIVIQVAAPSDDEVRDDGPLRVATVPRALLDLDASGASDIELKTLITAAIRASRLNHETMRRCVAAHPEAKNLHDAYRFYVPDRSAQSGLERSFDAGLTTRPNIPEPETNVHVEAGGIDWEIDRYWRDLRVAVELQGGPYHDAEPDRAKDELKAVKLQQIGITLYTISDTRWELEPGACLDDLELLLLTVFTKP